MSEEITIRGAKASDAEAIATLFKSTRQHNLAYLPVLHTAQEDLEYFRDVIKGETVVIAELDNKVIGFSAYKNNWLNHLYILPEYQGKGAGTALLNNAKSNNSEQIYGYSKKT